MHWVHVFVLRVAEFEVRCQKLSKTNRNNCAAGCQMGPLETMSFKIDDKLRKKREKKNERKKEEKKKKKIRS